jgi:hypothetical protein
LASGRLSPLLAVEIAAAGRAPANRSGIARADPADEQGEFALGCAAHPRLGDDSLGAAFVEVGNDGIAIGLRRMLCAARLVAFSLFDGSSSSV